MGDQVNFREKFRLQREVHNNVNNPVHLGRFQNVVYDFMVGVRANSYDHSLGQEPMDEFCVLLDDDDVWCQATAKVSEFRFSWEEQCVRKPLG